jgi:hypothetical protein
MKPIDRRTFIKLAGLGSAAAAVVSLPAAAVQSITGNGRLAFKATAGLPAKPLPAYATQVVEGTVDLNLGMGVVTSQVFAGHSEGVSNIALPGLTRVIRITGAHQMGATTQLTGVIDDRSSLSRGESSQVEILVDRARGIVRVPLAGNQVTLNLLS